MSLTSRFELLPRPPRSRLSLGSEERRATLPDFVDAQQLLQFVRRLFIYKLDVPGSFVQIKLGACIIGLLVAVVSLISLRRIFLRSFWLFRLVKCPSGTLIVPNSVLIFSIVEGIFSIFFITFQWLVCNFYQHKNMRPTNFCLWYLLLWIPLIFAPIWAAQATYFALPCSLESPDNRTQRWYSRPTFFNLLGLAIPAGLALSVLVPAIVANRFYRTAYEEHISYLDTYGSSTQLSQAMVQDAQRVWYDVLKAIKIVNITFIIWTIWALCMCVSYSYVSWRIISAIAKQLKASQDPIFTSRPWQHEEKLRKQHDRPHSQTSTSMSSPSNFKPPSLPHNACLHHSRNLQKLQELEDKKTVHNICFVEAEMENGTLSKPFFLHVRPSRFFHDGHTRKTKGCEGLAKRADEGMKSIDCPQNPKQQRKQQLQQPRNVSFVSASSPPTKKSELYGAYIHLWIQFAAIGPAAFFFALAACSLGVGSYGLYEQPRGTDLDNMGIGFERLFVCELLAKMWIFCIFGTITLTANVVKTYEHVLTNLTMTVPVIGQVPTRRSTTLSSVANPGASSFFESMTTYEETAGTRERHDGRRKQEHRLFPLKEVAEPPSSPTANQQPFCAPSMGSSRLLWTTKSCVHPARAAVDNVANHSAARSQGGVWYRLWEPKGTQ